MTAVTFPLWQPRLAFAVCWQRWQNNEYENKVWCVCHVKLLQRIIRAKVFFIFHCCRGPLCNLWLLVK